MSAPNDLIAKCLDILPTMRMDDQCRKALERQIRAGNASAIFVVMHQPAMRERREATHAAA